MERLKSRKFWVTVLTGVTLVVAEALGVELDEATVQSVVATVAAYLLGQGYADGQAAKAKALPPSSASTSEG